MLDRLQYIFNEVKNRPYNSKMDDNIKKKIQGAIDNELYVIIRATQNIGGDLKRNWSAWMGTRNKDLKKLIEDFYLEVRLTNGYGDNYIESLNFNEFKDEIYDEDSRLYDEELQQMSEKDLMLYFADLTGNDIRYDKYSKEDNIVILHFSIGSPVSKKFLRLKDKKAIIYHNGISCFDVSGDSLNEVLGNIQNIINDPWPFFNGEYVNTKTETVKVLGRLEPEPSIQGYWYVLSTTDYEVE